MYTELTPQTNNNTVPDIVSVRSLLDIRKTCPKYKDLDQTVRRSWLSERIVYCNVLNHQKPDPKVLLVDTAALDDAIMHDSTLADFTQSELSFAMFHGTMGEYGEYYGLTARTFLSFFREFCRTDVKYMATFEEKKRNEPDRGSWVLERMEHHRKQVQAELALRESLEEDEDGPIDTEKIRQTILNASKTPKQ